jgi:hypothetical protein
MLDVGCGLKPYQYTLPKISWFGFDISDGPKVDLIIGGSKKWKVSSHKFDGVLCTEVLEHAADPDFVLHEIQRMKKSGAVALISNQFIYGVHWALNEYRRYTNYGLIHNCYGFKVVDSGLLGGIGSASVINLNNWVFTN